MMRRLRVFDKSRHQLLYTQLDDEDFDKYVEFPWMVNWSNSSRPHWVSKPYIRIYIKGNTYTLSRIIVNAPKNLLVDHIDGNTLNNCRHNLRLVTRSQNAMNQRVKKGSSSSQYKGVRFRPEHSRRAKPWEVKTKINQVYYHLGSYATEEEAAIAYDDFARKHFGPYALLNFPDS